MLFFPASIKDMLVEILIISGPTSLAICMKHIVKRIFFLPLLLSPPISGSLLLSSSTILKSANWCIHNTTTYYSNLFDLMLAITFCNLAGFPIIGGKEMFINLCLCIHPPLKPTHRTLM